MDWPAPLLQPTPDTGCIEHAVAYLARCLGFADVTPLMVMQAAGRGESPAGERYIPTVLCYPVELWWDHKDDEPARRLWWLGVNARGWVEQRIAAGQIALVIVERMAYRPHAVALLETCGGDGVLLMDPLYGHIVEPWPWFLGVGPGQSGAHHLAGSHPLLLFVAVIVWVICATIYERLGFVVSDALALIPTICNCPGSTGGKLIEQSKPLLQHRPFLFCEGHVSTFVLYHHSFSSLLTISTMRWYERYTQ